MPDDYRSLLAESGPGTLAGVLRLLAPGGPEGFNMEAEQRSLLTLGNDQGFWYREEAWEYDGENQVRFLAATKVRTDARVWGVFDTGETCWWLPIREDPAEWLVLIVGNGWQQLNISTTEFLRRWTGGLLDLPVLAHSAVSRGWHITPAGQPVIVPDVPEIARNPLAQWQTIVGPGHSTPVSFDWAAIEADLGRPLPPDYKLLHETYGRVSDGVPYGPGALVWNGINIPSPLALKKTHEMHAEYDAFTPIGEPDNPDFPAPDEMLLCCTTEGRDLLAWDTRNPDPALWPVINMEFAGPDIFPGTLTEMLVAEFTGTGPDLAYHMPGDPAGWTYPFWGPDAAWENS
jgi:hypothetical protein